MFYMFEKDCIYKLTVIVNKAVLKFNSMKYLGLYNDKALFVDTQCKIVCLLVGYDDVVKVKKVK